MRRVCLAIALLVVSSAGAASFLPSSDAAREVRGYSHRITVVSGQLVDHWTVTDTAPCHATGGGTLKVKFRFARVKLVKLILDPYHSSNTPGKLGSWVVGIPYPNGGGLRDMPYQPATGTITFADGTTQNPPAGCRRLRAAGQVRLRHVRAPGYRQEPHRGLQPPVSQRRPVGRLLPLAAGRVPRRTDLHLQRADRRGNA